MPAGVARVLQLLHLLKKHFGEAERWRAKWRARTASNFKLRLAVLMGVSLLNVAVGAVLYKWTTAGEEDWKSAFFTVYAVLYGIPGSDVTNAPNQLATWVLNAIFIFGLMVFATTLAMITDEVNSLLSSARSGKAPLMLSGHILLLNWNSQVSFIIDQLEAVQEAGAGHPFAGKPIVILADKDKEEMDTLVVSFMKKHDLEVHTRSGKPYKLEHLERVSAGDAAAVLVLHPPDEDESTGVDDASSVSSSVLAGGAAGDVVGSAALKMQTMMALTALLQGKKTAVVVQVPESSGEGASQLFVLDQVLEMAGHETHLLNLPVKRMVNSLAVQTTLQPWSATIYHNILQYGLQPSITFVELPTALCTRTSDPAPNNSHNGNTSNVDILPSSARQAQSRYSSKKGGIESSYATYEDVRVHFGTQMLLLGFIRKRQLVLNPAEGSVLVAGDMLVGLTKRVQGVTAKVQPNWFGPSLIPLLQQKAASMFTKKPKMTPAGSVTVGNATAVASGAATAASSQPTKQSAQQQDASRDTADTDDDPQAHSIAAATAAEIVESADGQQAATDTATNLTGVVLPGQQIQSSDTPKPASLQPSTLTTASGDGTTSPGAAAAAAASSAVAAAPNAPAVRVTRFADSAGDDLADDITCNRDQDRPRSAKMVDSGSSKAVGPVEQQGQAATAAVGVAAAAVVTQAAGGDVTGQASTAGITDVPSSQAMAAAPPAAAPAGPESGAEAVASSAVDIDKVLTQPKAKKSLSQTLRRLCCAAPSVKDDATAAAADSAQSALKSSSSSDKTSTNKFKNSAMLVKGAAALTKGVTGAVTGVTGAVGTVTGTVITGAVSGVTAVAEGAASVSKTVVTGATTAVTSVADGAVNLSKTVVKEATSAVTTVADGALTISKGAVSAVTTVGSAVGTAVTSTAGMVKSEITSIGSATSNLASGKSFSRTLSSPADKQPAWAPTTWIFGAGKKLQQSTAKALANMRLSKLENVERGPPKTKLRIVATGFTGSEIVGDLLPQFLDFAPPGSTVTCVVRDGEELPEGYESEGVLEEQEEQDDGSIVHHKIHYKFLPSSNPTSRDTLAAAGLLAADSVLLAADESLRGSPAKADAQVLAALVEIQHLLASTRVRQDSRASMATQSTTAVSNSSSSKSSKNLATAAAAGLLSSSKSLLKKAGSLSHAVVPFTVENSQGSAAAAAALEQQQQQALAWETRLRPPHVVACVATTSAKAVAAAFFGPPTAAACAAADDLAADDSSSSCGVVGQGLFTYELLVPGEVEGAVLVQAAQEPLYEQVVHQLLATSQGCELYLLTPAAFGFSAGETLSFAEVSEVGRLLRKTVLGVIAGGHIELVPDVSWTWSVRTQDRIAVIAECW